MKKIEAFQTTDEKVFTDLGVAMIHQAKLDFISIYNQREDQLSGRYENSTIYGDVLADWLLENKELVLSLFG